MADRSLRRLRLVVAGLLGLALLALALPGLAGQYPQTTLEPKSQLAAMQDALLDTIVFWCVIIFVLVEGALVVTVLRFRRRPGGPAPKPIHGKPSKALGKSLATRFMNFLSWVPVVIMRM